ncbi:GNAT family N-acetyltransferase [Konateibacter massiliensis]|uniref:GNAT family N-acetyltransferase n=1 Tax=Konateibacter massiliensis TaxID=2002841 RepID=UPI000C15E167|nr:GNAT family N-acetyltransferase [Konateibacter massiliensis]
MANDNIEYFENTVTAQDLVYLQAAVGFGNADFEQADKAIQNSLYTICAKNAGKTIGMGRVIGDGARIFYLQDVFISPEFQRKGIGTQLINQMLNYIKKNSFAGAYTTVGLMAAKGKENFYINLGFHVRPTDTEGAGMLYTFLG